MVREVEVRLGSELAAEAVESVLDVGRVPDLAGFAVADHVESDVDLALDDVGDGEASKIGYATYIKDRFNGFSGEFTPKPHLDLADHPEFRKRMTAFLGSQTFRRLTCTAPVSIQDANAVKIAIENFRAALASSHAVEGFLNAASPGVVSSFQPNRYYLSHEAYIEALAAALKPEYE